MMVRFLVLLPLLAGIVLAAGGHEGASQTQSARATIASAAALPFSLRAQALGEAAARLERNWAQPLLWHAGAADTLSAIQALRWEATGDRRFLAQSVSAARDALHLSPAAYAPWVRLAKLALLGTPGVPCSVEQCLVISWRAAPLADAETDCIRLQLWREANLPMDRIRVHIDRYVRSGAGADAVAQCLTFLTPSERFDLLMARTRAAPR
jgi:hypothetical protein